MEKDIYGYEPTQALEGGLDGFRVFNKIVKKSSILLKRGGKLVLEIGFDQKIKMFELIKKEKFFLNKTVQRL